MAVPTCCVVNFSLAQHFMVLDPEGWRRFAGRSTERSRTGSSVDQPLEVAVRLVPAHADDACVALLAVRVDALRVEVATPVRPAAHVERRLREAAHVVHARDQAVADIELYAFRVRFRADGDRTRCERLIGDAAPEGCAGHHADTCAEAKVPRVSLLTRIASALAS